MGAPWRLLLIPLDQQEWGVGAAGDCMVTCIESILELPQGTLPKPRREHFMAFEEFAKHCDEVDTELQKLNLTLLFLAPESPIPAGYAVITQWHHADDPERKCGHARVAYGGEIVHDPCPVMRGVELGPIIDWLVLLPLDPARACAFSPEAP